MERLILILVGIAAGFFAGVVISSIVAGIVWCGYSVAWGEFAPFALYRLIAGMFGTVICIATTVMGGIAGAEAD